MTSSYSNLNDMKNSIIEIPKVRLQLLVWWISLHTCVHYSMYRCAESVVHATFSRLLGEPPVFAEKCYQTNTKWIVAMESKAALYLILVPNQLTIPSP